MREFKKKNKIEDVVWLRSDNERITKVEDVID